MSFYAGADPRRPAAPPAQAATLEQPIHAAVGSHSRYIDPERAGSTMPAVAMARAGRQPRRGGGLRLIPTRLCKRVILRRFLTGSAVTFHRDTRHVPDHATVAFRGWRGPRSCRDGPPPGGGGIPRPGGWRAC